jgi:hypothetical protein
MSYTLNESQEKANEFETFTSTLGVCVWFRVLCERDSNANGGAERRCSQDFARKAVVGKVA